ncbi:MAG: hypothetical protein IJN42_02395, partial [Clostridia bacterium]|nr:hypothetical protein [Clostridia bacterium]
MARDYGASHDYIEPEAEEKTLGDGFVGKTRFALRFSRYLLLSVFVLILAITVMVNRDSINMDNLRRLFTKFDIGISTNADVDGQQIEFAFEEDATVRSFKDGLAYLTPSSLTIMDNQGTVFMTTETGFSTPELLTSARYTVAYDRGGTDLLVTNSFAVVFEKTMTEKIVYITISDENYLSVITSGGGYKNSLYVYDSSFEEVYVWHSNDRYLLNALVSPDRKTVALVCYNTVSEETRAELVGIKLDAEEIAWSAPLTDLPLDMCYKSNNQIALLFEDRLDFYSGKGSVGHSYAFEKNFLQAFSLERDHSLLVLSAGKLGDSTLYGINNRGKESFEFEAGGRIRSMDVKGSSVAMLTDGETLVYSTTSEK